MTGELWIDPTQERVARLEGHLQQDVDFGWGILGRLNKGGWIVIEQANVGEHQWRIVHFKMSMSGRVVFKTKVFDTTEDESQFAAATSWDLSYQQAIQMMNSEPGRLNAAPPAKNKAAPTKPGPLYCNCSSPYLILMKIMAKVNRVSDSMKARPRIISN